VKDIGVAIVGTGFIGPAHADALKRVGVGVIGILGSSKAKSERAAESLELSKAYADMDEVLSDETAHSVHITTSNNLHYEMVKCVLAAEA